MPTTQWQRPRCSARIFTTALALTFSLLSLQAWGNVEMHADAGRQGENTTGTQSQTDHNNAPTSTESRSSEPTSSSSQNEAQEDSSRLEEAQHLKHLGDESMQDLRYQDALDYYRRAYKLSKNPALLYNQGRACEALHRFPQALKLVERFAAEAPEELRARVPHLKELLASLRLKVGKLRLKVNVAGARVLVRGQSVGKAPLAPIALNAGDASVEVTAEGYKSIRKQVTLAGAEELELDIWLEPIATTGVLLIRSPIVGARVSVDGQPAGNVPVELELPSGKHKLWVSAEGYHPAETVAVVEVNQRKDVTIELDKVAPLTSQWWFWTSIAGAAVAAAVVTIAATTERAPDTGTIGRVPAPLLAF